MESKNLLLGGDAAGRELNPTICPADEAVAARGTKQSGYGSQPAPSVPPR